MEIRLHLGAHKTASTYLQMRLAAGRDLLAAEGVAVPQLAALRAGLGPALHLAARAPWPVAALARRRIARVLAGHGRGARLLVISEENLLGLPGQFGQPARFYPAAAARLAALARALPVPPSTVCLGLRCLADFHPSAWSQRVRGGRVPAFDAAARDRLLALDRGWPDLVAEVRAAFPSARLVLWDHADLAAVEAELLGRLVGPVAAALPPLAARPLAGLSDPAARAVLASRPAGTRIARAEFDAVAARWPRSRHPPFDPWTAAERARLAARHAADLATIDAAHPGARLRAPAPAAAAAGT